jgi:hypothetical protein
MNAFQGTKFVKENILIFRFLETTAIANFGIDWFREKKLYGMIPSSFILSEVLDS